jgi:hypothetical protein
MRSYPQQSRPKDQQSRPKDDYVDERSGIKTVAKARMPTSAVALSASFGVLIVAVAYTAGRLGYASAPWADWLYWLGQAFIILPVSIRLIARWRLTEKDTAILVVVLTVAEYLTTVCYSPAAFTYSDELEHWRSATNLLSSGKLYTANYLLPISPHYPGLEEVTSALDSVTGLPLFVCGLIVAGVAHATFVGSLYLLFHHISGSHRIAGIAVLFYSSNPDLPFFDSFFSYQTLGVAFLGIALLAIWSIASSEKYESIAGWVVLALAAIIGTVVTHHVTSYVLVGVLFLIAFTSLIVGENRRLLPIGILAVISALIAVCWLTFAAPETISYLQPTAENTLRSVQSVVSGGHSSAPPVSNGPFSNRLLGMAAVLLASLILPFGLWHVWQNFRRQAWIVAMAIGSLSWYAVVAVRLLVADGSELAGRASTFVFVPTAFIAALAVPRVATILSRHVLTVACCIVAANVLLFDGLANSWPPYWERLPGAYQAGGDERSVSPEGIDAAEWALSALGPGNRFAADIGNTPLLGSYGDQNPIFGVSFIYTSSTFRESDAEEIQALSIAYVLVDLRLSQMLPISGRYFAVDPNHYSHPLSRAGLTKFNHIPGVSRSYDSGNIVIYSLEGSEYYGSQ